MQQILQTQEMAARSSMLAVAITFLLAAPPAFSE
jgi:hypothetical protein